MTTYKHLSDIIVAKIDDDGLSRMSCSIDNPEYLAWLAEGNTPEPADPPPVIPYTELRAAAYPPIGDQLDALFKAGVFPPDMAAKIQAVKDAYPKP